MSLWTTSNIQLSLPGRRAMSQRCTPRACGITPPRSEHGTSLDSQHDVPETRARPASTRHGAGQQYRAETRLQAAPLPAAERGAAHQTHFGSTDECTSSAAATGAAPGAPATYTSLSIAEGAGRRPQAAAVALHQPTSAALPSAPRVQLSAMGAAPSALAPHTSLSSAESAGRRPRPWHCS